MPQERILQSEQVTEFRALGEQLQMRITELVRQQMHVGPDLFAEYQTVIRDNQTVFDNLVRATTAAVALSQFLEKMLGMSVEGCLVTMGGKEPTIKTGIWATLALTNQRVRAAIANADRLIAKIETNKEAACHDE